MLSNLMGGIWSVIRLIIGKHTNTHKLWWMVCALYNGQIDSLQLSLAVKRRQTFRLWFSSTTAAPFASENPLRAYTTHHTTLDLCNHIARFVFVSACTAGTCRRILCARNCTTYVYTCTHTPERWSNTTFAKSGTMLCVTHTHHTHTQTTEHTPTSRRTGTQPTKYTLYTLWWMFALIIIRLVLIAAHG